MDLTEIVKKFDGYPNCLAICSFDSPVGNMIAVADSSFLYLVSFEDAKNFAKKLESLHKELSCSFEENETNKVLIKLKDEMTSYFMGKLKKFSLPLKTFGSDFQKEVWDKLQEIPYASTHTYGELATAMGRAGSHARAIGAACGANAHLIVIPCHRLVASASKGGFNAGVDRKDWLLQHEKKYEK